MYTYTVHIYTGSLSWAGTNANVHLTLYGNNGESEEQTFKNDGKVFQSGMKDTFTVDAQQSLGTLTKVRIGHDNTGLLPGWFVIKVAVEDDSTGEAVVFDCNQWFDLESGDGNTRRELTPTGQYQRETCLYRISFHTGTVVFAGTDANVFATIYGTKRDSGERTFENKGSSTSENGMIDTHEVETKLPLGTLTKVRVRHDNTGAGAGWFLDKVIVEDTVNNQVVVFPCGLELWLATNADDDGLIERELIGDDFEQRDEEAKQREKEKLKEEERKRKEEEEKRQREQDEKKRREEEQKQKHQNERRKQEEVRKRRREEERLKREERKRRLELDIVNANEEKDKKDEEEMKRREEERKEREEKMRQERERRKKEEEERRKQEEEQKRLEDERRQEEEREKLEQQKKMEEEEEKRRNEEEQRKREEEKRKSEEEEEKRRVTEEEKKKAEEEEKRKREEEETRRIEEEAKRRKEEAEKLIKEREERRRTLLLEEEERKRLGKYKVNLFTEDAFGTWTGASILFTLYGTDGESSELCIKSEGENSFGDGMKGTITVECPHNLGTLTHIRIAPEDQSGLASPWFLVTVEDPKTNDIVVFTCNRSIDQEELDKAHMYYPSHIDDVKALLAMETDLSENWIRVKKTRKAEVWRKKETTKETPAVTKASLLLKGVPYQSAVKYFTDWEHRREWDKSFADIDVLEQIGHLKVIYCSNKMPIFCKKRDMVLACLDHHDQQYHTQTMCSILHPSVPQPPTKSNIRAKTFMLDIVIRPVDDGTQSSKVTVITQVDLRGTAPQLIKNSYLTNSPIKWMKMMRKYHKKCNTESAKSDDQIFGNNNVNGESNNISRASKIRSSKSRGIRSSKSRGSKSRGSKSRDTKTSDSKNVPSKEATV